jgi:hypothetical protein
MSQVSSSTPAPSILQRVENAASSAVSAVEGAASSVVSGVQNLVTGAQAFADSSEAAVLLKFASYVQSVASSPLAQAALIADGIPAATASAILADGLKFANLITTFVPLEQKIAAQAAAAVTAVQSATQSPTSSPAVPAEAVSVPAAPASAVPGTGAKE